MDGGFTVDVHCLGRKAGGGESAAEVGPIKVDWAKKLWKHCGKIGGGTQQWVYICRRV